MVCIELGLRALAMFLELFMSGNGPQRGASNNVGRNLVCICLAMVRIELGLMALTMFLDLLVRQWSAARWVPWRRPFIVFGLIIVCIVLGPIALNMFLNSSDWQWFVIFWV